MKVPGSIRSLYEEQVGIYERLKIKVEVTVQALRQPRWHYEGRVKGLQSYALKLESGRYPDPRALEDFFACTLVVANLAEVAEAEALINSTFDLKARRPGDAARTHKRSDAFPFDDLRLYVAIKPDSNLPPTGLEGIQFEFQVKTFLQHAWSIATHDLVYKTDDISWSKERIAYQTKAMLEHAEISIQEADKLAMSGALAVEDKSTSELKQAIAMLRGQWESDQLPADIRRLATHVLQLLRGLDLTLERLTGILDAGKAASGSHPTNLSPYGAILQYLFTAERIRFDRHLRRTDRRPPVLLTSEITIPPDLDRSAWVNAVSVG